VDSKKMSLIQSFMNKAPAFNLATMLEKRGFAAAATGISNSNVLNKQLPLINQSLFNPLGSIRHAGASALACGIATVALGGVAQGVGSVFAALVVGTARNPAIKDDLFAYTMIGFGMVELIMFIVVIFAVMLLMSE